jgi:hypothetical protein
LDKNIFLKNDKKESPPIVKPTMKDERNNQQGVVDGADYQTLDNLDKNIFVQKWN